MKLRICRLFAIAALVFCCFAGAQALAQNAYITNLDANTVSVIDTTSNTVTATIPVGSGPLGVAVSPDGSTVYVTNFHGNTVSVIATASNTVTATIPLGNNPFGVAVTPDGSTVYVTNQGGPNTVSVMRDPVGPKMQPTFFSRQRGRPQGLRGNNPKLPRLPVATRP